MSLRIFQTKDGSWSLGSFIVLMQNNLKVKKFAYKIKKPKINCLLSYIKILNVGSNGFEPTPL